MKEVNDSFTIFSSILRVVDGASSSFSIFHIFILSIHFIVGLFFVWTYARIFFLFFSMSLNRPLQLVPALG